jgi:serine/threonine-protein kinase RsbW
MSAFATVRAMQHLEPVAPSDDVIEVRVPAAARAASTLRVLAASLAADAGYAFDDIDDIRLALNEMFTSCASERSGERIVVSFSVDVAEFRVELRPETRDAPVELDSLAVQIVRSVTDSFDASSDRLCFVKRRSAAT